jgi:RHS repeat-associated protein
MPRQKRLHNATGSYHVMLRGDTTLLTGGISHPFRFTGKELDRQNSLNMYDFGARWYDVAGVPMWTSIDPLAEKYYNVTPYSYCAGDPVNKIDPDGRASGDYYNTSGKQIGNDGIDDDKKYMVLNSDEQKLIKKQKTVAQDKLSSSIPVPSDNIINRADEALKNSDINEHGFVVAIDNTTSNIISGNSGSIKLGTGYQELENNGKQSSFDVHTHSFEYKVLPNGKCHYTNSEPSGADLSYRAMKETNNAVNQLSWIIGKAPLNFPKNGDPQTTVNITFYNSKGSIATMGWNSFKKAVNLINQ